MVWIKKKKVVTQCLLQRPLTSSANCSCLQWALNQFLNMQPSPSTSAIPQSEMSWSILEIQRGSGAGRETNKVTSRKRNVLRVSSCLRAGGQGAGEIAWHHHRGVKGTIALLIRALSHSSWVTSVSYSCWQVLLSLGCQGNLSNSFPTERPLSKEKVSC